MSIPFPDAPTELPVIIERYVNQIDELDALLRGFSPDQLRARPVPGKWSALELLCHLCDSEQVMSERFKRAAAIDKSLVMAYPEDRYVTHLAYDRRDPAEEAVLIRATRIQTARIMRHLKPAAWNHTAVHSERGFFTVKDLARYAIGHMAHHLAFIPEKRKALGLP